MSLNVRTRKVDGVVIVDMSGRLTIGEPVLLLRETLRVQVNDGARQFVLNLGEVSYIDSSGLGQLISIWTSIRNKNGHMTILNPAKRVERLFEITRLNTVFEILQNEDEAVQKAQKAE